MAWSENLSRSHSYSRDLIQKSFTNFQQKKQTKKRFVLMQSYYKQHTSHHLQISMEQILF